MKPLPALLLGFALIGATVWSDVREVQETHAQAAAMQQIAANTQSIADSLHHPPAAPENEECHVALSLFDEMLRHEMKVCHK